MMKPIFALVLLFTMKTEFLYAQPAFEISRNIYRVPYANNTEVEISNDHFSHEPQGRYDMSGTGRLGSCGTVYAIVAAAAGVVRRIVDHHNVRGPDCTSNCSDYNNYVWIEHANGEWSKYTHFTRYSPTVFGGLSVGDCVAAGQLLGYECEIGQASGPHLHFEVRHPNDPDNIQIDVAGGGMSNAEHRIPAICGVSKNYFESGDDFTALACGSCNPLDNATISNRIAFTNSVYVNIVGGTITTGVNTNFSSTSSTMLKANDGIVFKPGLKVSKGASFSARTGHCSTTAFTGSCN